MTEAAVSLLAALCLASCTNDDDDESSSSVVATYNRTEDSEWAKIFLYSDGTASKAVQEALELGVKDGVIKTGTFVKDGDSYTDCSITITWEREIQRDLEWHNVADTDEEKEQTFIFADRTSSGGWAYQSE
ncbi:hypothetical protein [Treponema zioleckii]|uniref:hypothetical protein n=1 Tax=Treponema zioleckii TaxID=331680 RepID=UPI00168B0427|nr:hypothetical protein [Treponema zioleckii]